MDTHVKELTTPLTISAERASGEGVFEICRGLQGLAMIRKEWEQLTQNWGNARFFQLYEWYESYIETLAEGEVFFLLFCPGGIIEMILPLVLGRQVIGGLSLRTLSLPQHPHLSLGDGIFAKQIKHEAMIPAAVSFLRQQMKWDVLLFPCLLEDSNLRLALQAKTPALTIAKSVSHCDYVSCQTAIELNLRVSKNFRDNLRKARNKLKTLPAVEFVSVHRSAELPTAFEEFLQVETSGWKGTNGTHSAIRLDARIRAFYEALLENFGRIDACEINLLKTEGQTIAGQFCLLSGDTSYILKIGYDENYAQVAPGNLLLEHTLQRYAEGGPIKFINLVTDAVWHERWQPQQLSVSAFSVFNTTPAGLTVFIFMKTKQFLQRILPKSIKELVKR